MCERSSLRRVVWCEAVSLCEEWDAVLDVEEMQFKACREAIANSARQGREIEYEPLISMKSGA